MTMNVKTKWDDLLHVNGLLKNITYFTPLLSYFLLILKKKKFMFIRIYIKHGNCGEHFLKTITDQILVYLKHFPQSIYIYILIGKVNDTLTPNTQAKKTIIITLAIQPQCMPKSLKREGCGHKLQCRVSHYLMWDLSE